MIRGNPEPDQAERDGKPLINVHLDILTSLERTTGSERQHLKLSTSSMHHSGLKSVVIIRMFVF